MPYSVEHLVSHVRKHFPNQKVAFASMIPKAPGQRVKKTNRLDSRLLAQNLRGGQLKSIHVPTGVYRELRHLTQLRDTSFLSATWWG
jgi:hypothetical protein